MLVAGLMVAIIIIAALIFILKTPVVMRIASMFLVVLALILVIALTNSNMQQMVNPIEVEGTKVYMYDKDGFKKEFQKSSVNSVDVGKKEGGGLIVTVEAKGEVFSFETSKLTYEWTLRNQLHKHFSHVLTDRTF